MSRSILIADSSEIIRRGIRTLFEGRVEWKICGEAGTGEEAIEKVKALTPDVLLLDVGLPDMDPAEAVSEIKAACPTARIVALAMPGSGEPAARAMAAGAIGLAMKSDAATEFLRAIQHIVLSQPFFSPAASRLLEGNPVRSEMPGDLTVREFQIIKLLAKGQTNREVARALGISVRTVDVHRTNIMRKLKLATYSELVQFAVRHNLIEG
jgi:DNA-binding NarL/FixJ family response regulator